MKLKRQGDAREFEVELLAQNKQDQPDHPDREARTAGVPCVSP